MTPEQYAKTWKEGQKLYRYYDSIGLVKLTFIRIEGFNCICKKSDKEDDTLKFYIGTAKSFYLTEDMAYIAFFKENAAAINKKITNLSNELNEEKNLLKALNKNFEHLMIKYPEEFV